MLNHHAAHLSVCLCLHIQVAACVKGEEDDQEEEEEEGGGGCKMKHETCYLKVKGKNLKIKQCKSLR
jgi:hypothetical protein